MRHQLSIALALACAPIQVIAQQSSVSASSRSTYLSSCTYDSGILSSSAVGSCYSTQASGSSLSSGAAEVPTRSVSSALSMSAASDGSVAGNALARYYGRIVLDGNLEGSSLLFHVARSGYLDIASTGSYGRWDLVLSAATGSGLERGLSPLYPGFGGITHEQSPNVSLTSSGLDFSFALGGYGTATYGNVYGFYLEAYTYAKVHYPGSISSAQVNLDASLTGVDLVDASGRLVSSARFEDDGQAYLSVSAAPEPATVLLMATGIALVGIAVRRKRNGA
jgi:hypothetical protein